MSTLITEREVFAESIQFSDDSITVRLDDGRTISVPLAWYPRLLHGTSAERENFELIGDGEGIHWPALDEDISVEGLIAGKRSAESDTSLARWLDKPIVPVPTKATSRSPPQSALLRAPAVRAPRPRATSCVSNRR